MKTGKHLGVLTQVQEAEGVHGTFTKGLVRSIACEPAFFHQNSLLDKSEGGKQLADGLFVFFDTRVKKLDKRDRLDATNCVLAQPSQVLSFMLDAGKAAIEFVGEYAASTFLVAVRREADQLNAGTLEPHQLANLADLKSHFGRPVLAKAKFSRPEAPDKPVKRQQKPAAGAGRFLHSVFASNSPEYNLQLFNLLTEGIRSINDDDAFTQACFLLEFNAQLTEGRQPSLPASFYELASPAYRFQLWLQGVVPYCDPTVLLNEYTKGDDTLRAIILERCPVDSLDLLNGSGQHQLPAQVEAHFSNIKTLILTEADAARTTIQVAVAWFTHDELFGLLCAKLAQGVKVELIINNDYINNWEYGLPFQDFIQQGGLLYLSEAPSMMHHKFCLIDEAVLLTGSYNWTYYAELHNEENLLLIKEDAACLNAFKAEFARLKALLKEPVQIITPFPATELPRFERLGFRQYLSKDIESRVSYTKQRQPKADIQTLAQWLDKAVEIDEQNTTARELQKDFAPKVALEQGVIQAQRVVQDVLATVPAASKVDPAPLSSAPVNLPPATTKAVPANPLSTSAPATAAAQSPVVMGVPKPASPPPTPVTQRPITPPAPAKPIASATAPSPSTTRPAPTNLTQPAAATPIVNTAISIPASQSQAPLFTNLQLVFALDYSGSMEGSGSPGQAGYQLYSTGKVQKVIDMIFAICKGLTASSKVDMFLFEKQAKQLPPVTESNYRTYIQEEVLKKHKMDGTNIFAPIEAIHSKYAQVAENNVFVILITDGENSEPTDNERIKNYFREHNSLPIFWQFVGLGGKFAFLEEVDKLAPNTAFFNLNDVQTVAEDTLLARVLQKFPVWYKQVRLEVPK